MSNIYHLMQNENVLAVITQTSGDFAWSIAKFEPTDKYAEFEYLFQREYELLEAEDWDEWEKIYSEFQKLNIHIVDVTTNEKINEFLLHIIGYEAHFRY